MAKLYSPCSTRNTVLFGWDGVSRYLIKKGLDLGYLPNFRSLLANGSFVEIDVHHTTDSKTGWAQILTGYDPEITGVFSNKNYRVIPRTLTIFDRLNKFHNSEDFISAGFVGSSIKAILPQQVPVRNENVLINCLPHDNATCSAALSFLDYYRNKSFFLFIHFEETDLSAHIFGDGSRGQFSALLSTDERMGWVIGRLKELGLYENTLIYVVSDHGFDPGKRTHHNAPYVFFAANERGLKGNGTQADVAPTMMGRLGLELDQIEPPLSGNSLYIP